MANTNLNRVSFRPHVNGLSAAGPGIRISDGFAHKMGSHMEARLRDRHRMMLQVVSKNPDSHKGSKKKTDVVLGLGSEFPEMAVHQGFSNKLGQKYLSHLCRELFDNKGVNLPGYVGNIGKVVAAQSERGRNLVFEMLPSDSVILLNGKRQDGITTSAHFSALLSISAVNDDQCSDVLTEDAANQTVYSMICGALLRTPNWFSLVSTTLHEASHFKTQHQLESWMDKNAAKPVEAQDPLYKKACVTDESGQVKLDSRFAILFMELSACLAGGFYINQLVRSVESEKEEHCLIPLFEKRIRMMTSYLGEAAYQPYVQFSGIRVPNGLENFIEIFRRAKQFVDQIPEIE